MLHLLAALDEFTDVERNSFTRVPAIHRAALITARQNLAVHVPFKAGDPGLMPRHLADLLLHLRRW